MEVLKTKYTISTDWDVTAYCGVKLDWNYVARICYLSMLTYVMDTLNTFLHKMPTKVQHSPHPWLKPVYGAQNQNVAPPDEFTIVSAI